MTNNAIHLNGINGADGEYLMPELTIKQISRLAQGDKLETAHFEELKARHEAAEDSFGVGYGIDPEDLSQAGWGVILPHGIDPSIREAISPLLMHRRAQAGDLYKEYSGPEGYRPQDSARVWLARPPRNKGPGPVDPKKVPYYLLIVGDPENIPFRFQYELDVNYAVGRIHFDAIADYEQYARSVIAAETAAKSQARRRAVFFGVRNQADRATELSADCLVKPLAEAVEVSKQASWTVETINPDCATKEKLISLLVSDEPLSLLFTASHGMGFPKGDERQFGHQGALLCQNWLGPLKHKGAISPDLYFSADNLTVDACLSGLIAFHFACYGAGTPRWDDYAHKDNQRGEITEKAFIAGLVKKELSLPKGGALAVVGHIERAWTYSFQWPGAGEQLVVFQSTLKALMAGNRLGAAMEYFGMKYADLAVGLNNELEEIKFGKVPDDLALGSLWTAHNDSRSYVIIGDPAVRLK